MDVVDVWTGHRANALKTALRLTNESFARQLGTATRTVAKWNAEPDIVQIPELQQALDTALSRADDEVKARFALLAGGAKVSLASTPALMEMTGWIDQQACWSAGAAEARVVARLEQLSPHEIQRRSSRRGRVGRPIMAEAVAGYYGSSPQHPLVRATCGGRSIATTILAPPGGLDVRAALGVGRDRLRLDLDSGGPTHGADDVAADAAVQRVAEIVATGTHVFNSPLYRLNELTIGADGFTGSVGLADFVTYALTVDLLENELVDAIAEHSSADRRHLPLRARYLPDLATAADFGGRLCVGGALALFACARPAHRSGRPADYVLLIQERSGQVVNASRRLAVIPKAFHQPLVDLSDDTQISATLERELEEELLGRAELEPAGGQQRLADPLHPSRLSEPMRWLMDHPDPGVWQMECTGIGINLISGNYEFASLIVVHDEEWWARYGGRIETNWEASGIRRYSSRDRDILASLAHDAAWSNEGLFAYLAGLRRLAEAGGPRVDLPTITMET